MCSVQLCNILLNCLKFFNFASTERYEIQILLIEKDREQVKSKKG